MSKDCSDDLIVDNNKALMDRSRLPERVHIWDETMRGGEQTPGVYFTVEEKLELAGLMDEMGVAVIDAGFPLFSEGERRAIKALATQGFRTRIGATVRSLRTDIDAALGCEVSEIFSFMSTSRFHLQKKFGIDEAEAVRRAVDAVEYARQHGLRVTFISEDTSRSDLDFVADICTKAVDAGAEALIMCDTVNFIAPISMYNMVARVMDACPDVPFGVHCHNDFGLATANTLAAVNAGVTYPTLAVNGLGDSSGNPPAEEVIMALENLYGVDTGIRTERIYELSKLVEKYSGLYISPQKPVVGLNSFRHESEVHVTGVLADPLVYEPLRPESVGRQREFILGKHTGAKGAELVLARYGIKPGPEDMEKILARLKSEREAGSKARVNHMLHILEAYGDEVLAFPEERLAEIAREVMGDDRGAQSG